MDLENERDQVTYRCMKEVESKELWDRNLKNKLDQRKLNAEDPLGFGYLNCKREDHIICNRKNWLKQISRLLTTCQSVPPSDLPLLEVGFHDILQFKRNILVQPNQNTER